MTPKLTDERIVEAFKNCFMKNDTPCEKCPAFDGKCNATSDFLISQILDLINRLKAENQRHENTIRIADKLIKTLQEDDERFQKENDQFADIGKMYSEIKTEAYKEFAEELKDYAEPIYDDGVVLNGKSYVEVSDIDYIFEKMKGEN